MKVYSITAEDITLEPIIVETEEEAKEIHSFLTHLYNKKFNTDYFTYDERKEVDPETYDPEESFGEWSSRCGTIFCEVIENYEIKDE